MTILELLHDSEAHGGTEESHSGVTPPNYLIVMLACPDCGKAAIPTGQGEVSVGEALLRAGQCDAVIEDPEGNRRTTIPPRVRRQAFQRARFRCEARGCTNVHFLEIHHRKQVSGGGLRDLENLVVLCWQCHRDLHRAEEEARKVAKTAP